MGKHVQYDAGARDEIAAFFQNRAAALVDSRLIRFAPDELGDGFG